jgi:hypothetical protein
MLGSLFQSSVSGVLLVVSGWCTCQAGSTAQQQSSIEAQKGQGGNQYAD